MICHPKIVVSARKAQEAGAMSVHKVDTVTPLDLPDALCSPLAATLLRTVHDKRLL